MAKDAARAHSDLLGVALIVRSKHGPRFIFHYPPRLSSPDRDLPRWGTELDPTTPHPSDSEYDDDEDELEDDGLDVEKYRQERKQHTRHVHPWDGDVHYESEDGTQIVPWEHLDAFPTKELASILTPAKAYHKKCFELSLDPVYYVTYPMHIRDDGTWKKAKKQRRRRASVRDEQQADDESAAEDGKTSKAESAQAERSKEEPALGPTPSSSFGSEEGNDQSITMFNLVFVMNPNHSDASSRVRDMLENVAKDLNKALRFAQHYNNFVWKESETILLLKEKAREERTPMSALWTAILEKSTLAVAIKDVYNAISTDRIAAVRLDSAPPVKLSVQIPKPYFLPAPPRFDEEAMPGLWITTANCFDDADGDEASTLSKHATLLLLDDEIKIMTDIQSDGGELANPLLEYLKVLKPTSSFLQTAQLHGISLPDIRILAQHLIYYRRALAIPPIHGRNTYVLSPNSDNHQLPKASVAWRKRFPLATPLVTFLANISTLPRPFKYYAPSKAHRPMYLDMLTWLMRGGWVVQLRTFAWIIVWPEIRYEVQYELDAEMVKSAYDDAVRDAVDEARDNAAMSQGDVPLSTAELAEKARVQRTREKAKEDTVLFARRARPVRTEAPSMNFDTHVLQELPTVIADPAKPDHKTSLYLQAISKRFPQPHMQKMFMRFAKYFDGKQALEDIALKEGLKRKEAWNLLAQFDEFLLVTRHW